MVFPAKGHHGVKSTIKTQLIAYVYSTRKDYPRITEEL